MQLHEPNEELHDLCFSPDSAKRDQIKKNAIGDVRNGIIIGKPEEGNQF
jgi:hypothetical protein